MPQTDSVFIEAHPAAAAANNLPFYLITFLTGISYILMMSQWDYSAISIETSGKMLTAMPGVTGINSMQSAIGKALLGAVGGVLLLWPSRFDRSYKIVPLFFFSGYLLLCFSSVIWSANSELTIRRLLVLSLYMAGILGTVRHLTTRQLLDGAILVSLVFIALGVTAELVHGAFTPLLGNYRFAGTMHPNNQGSICAVLVIASFCGLKYSESGRGLYIAAFAAGILFLFLTKSRANIFGCLLAVYIASFWKTSPREKQVLVLMPVVLSCLLILAVSLAAPELLGRPGALLNLGRDLDSSDFTSFNGRIPLWLYLTDYILQRPFLGWGFSGFWTPEVVASFSNYSVNWAGNGHSVLIDLLLQVGLIGGFFFIMSVLSVLYVIVRECIRSGSVEAIFTFAITVYAVIFGLLESIFMTPQSFGAFVASVALFNACIGKNNAASIESSSRSE